jgi:GT2 family glycosyltransferase
MTIAALLTCFNRKQKTLACLNNLSKQVLRPGIKVDIYLTDDNSSDGTAAAVREQYPSVNVLDGTGSLYWAGGMRYTWRKALEGNYDFYLLLNDDTVLFENAIQSLVDTFQNNPYAPQRAICIGSTSDPATGKMSYGGSCLYKEKVWKSKPVYDAHQYINCDFANANILLVPKTVVEKIGILSDEYTHSLADYDYTLQARKVGFGVVQVPGFLGTCTDDHGNNWKSQKTSLSDRIKYLKSPKGLAYKEYLHFIQKHFPASRNSEFIKIWLKTFFPFIWDKFKPAKA